MSGADVDRLIDLEARAQRRADEHMRAGRFDRWRTCLVRWGRLSALLDKEFPPNPVPLGGG